VYGNPYCSSNHRVHHAVNDVYLDRNYGGVLLVWDRLFGTYAEEDPSVPCVYGTRAPLRSWNPVRANLQVYAELARDSWRTTGRLDKLRVWLEPPGWRPADVAARWPKAPFAVEAFERFDPAWSRRRGTLALAAFVVLLSATTFFLWNAHTLDWPERVGFALAIALGLCGVGGLSEGRSAFAQSGGDFRARALPSQAPPQASP